jgi:hypothetical protein
LVGTPPRARPTKGCDTMYYRTTKLGGTCALALFLAITHTPFGCAITGHTSEGFPVATCADGSQVYQDLDGQPYPNAAGNPVYPAGTWVAME